MYRLIKPLLFCLDPEKAHHVTLLFLSILHRCGLSCFIKQIVLEKPVKCMGIEFKNPVGLAAGLDKNAEYVDALALLGFGFIEVGTVTPRPQPGNPKPRLFRLKEHKAIINRFGFNSCGLDQFIEHCKKIKSDVTLGINIGKNTDTPLDKAIDDYLMCFTGVCPYADYITVNISSPNSPGLRDLQRGDYLSSLLGALKEQQAVLFNQVQRYVPLVVKVSPDLNQVEVGDIAAILLQHDVDGLIVGNTTLSRPGLEGLARSREAGGLSGQLLLPLSTDVLSRFNALLQGKVTLFGVGGISCAEDAHKKFQAGANLVQVYTGLIYEGPALINTILSRSDTCADRL